MQIRYLRSISNIFILIGLFIFCSSVASFLAAGVIMLISKVSIQDLTNVGYWQTASEGRWYMLLMQAISAAGSFFGTFWLYRRFFETEHKVISTKNEKLSVFILIIFLVIAAMPFVSGFLGELNQKIDFGTWAKEMELKLEVLTKFLISFDSFSQFLFGIFVIAIIPAIGEELLFRGILQRKLSEDMNVHLSIWLSAILFSAIHLQFLGFFPRMLLGALFGYLYYFSKDIRTAIFAHFINNAFTLLMVYLYQQKIITIDVVDKPALSLVVVFSSLLIALVIFVFIYTQFWKNKTEK